VAVRHELYEDCVHVFPAFLFLDASRKALQSARHFVRTALDKRGKRKSDIASRKRSAMDDEMRAGMENEDGEAVDSKTGERQGSAEAVRGGTESDGEGGQRSVPDKSDDEWNDFDEAIVRSSHVKQPYNGEKDKQDVLEMRRSKTQPHAKDDAKAVSSSAISAAGDDKQRARQESAPTTPHGHRPRHHSQRSNTGNISTLSSSVSNMSLEQARSRAQAGMRMQESRDAPQLAKFHALNKPLQPRMRRTASNATINSLIESWQQSSEGGGGGSPLNTRVYTPGP
jgi:hypothetical protein